jgi:hypothetical protein
MRQPEGKNTLTSASLSSASHPREPVWKGGAARRLGDIPPTMAEAYAVFYILKRSNLR